ncbi:MULTISPECIES: hypothetical protein [Mesorhizobium]|jgi:hypothetical protein|uniref:hypothetical protein n=1 Tax=Mesorhizobium TaxID=68287 RepID=UPI0013DF79F9|nr:hypothetical protein [Mesorhizobium ciceri]
MKNALMSAAIAHGGGADYLGLAAWLELLHDRGRLLNDLAVLGAVLLLLLLILLPLYPVLQDLQVVLPDQRIVAGSGIERLRGSRQANARQHCRGQHCHCEDR